MKPDITESLFADIARTYADQMGSVLTAELRDTARVPTPSLDGKVKARLRAHRLRKWQPALGAVVAAALLFLVLYALPGPLNVPELNDDSASGYIDGDAGDDDMDGVAPDDSDDMDGVAPDGSDDMDGAAPEVGAGDSIPLSFELPAYLSVSDTLIDREKTVYYLESTLGDDVVLTLRQEGEFESAGLGKMMLGDTLVYFADRGDYCILTFETADMIYEMTCKYDLNTLIALASEIV